MEPCVSRFPSIAASGLLRARACDRSGMLSLGFLGLVISYPQPRRTLPNPHSSCAIFSPALLRSVPVTLTERPARNKQYVARTGSACIDMVDRPVVTLGTPGIRSALGLCSRRASLSKNSALALALHCMHTAYCNFEIVVELKVAA